MIAESTSLRLQRLAVGDRLDRFRMCRQRLEPCVGERSVGAPAPSLGSLTAPAQFRPELVG
jgi:hypothetical protein